MYLHSAEAEVNEADSNDDTPLSLALMNKHDPIVAVLREAGASEGTGEFAVVTKPSKQRNQVKNSKRKAEQVSFDSPV